MACVGDVSLPQVGARPNVLILDGEIDLHLSPEVAASLQAIILTHPTNVVVDLGRVTYLDSSGLAVLINGMRETKKYGGQFSLVAVQESVLQILEIACLDEVFTILPDAGRALGAA